MKAVLSGLTLVKRLPRERRQAQRFPIERDLYYRIMNHRPGPISGQGKTLNISSSGILFDADQTLAIGTRIELSVSWPTGPVLMGSPRLNAKGRIARLSNGQLVMLIERYQFHSHRK